MEERSSVEVSWICAAEQNGRHRNRNGRRRSKFADSDGPGGARRRGKTESVEAPKTLVMSMVVSCGNRDEQRWGAGLDFGRWESFDDSHGPRALRAKPKITRTGGGDFWLG